MSRWPTLLRRPSAWLPVAMSAAALAVVATHVLLHGGAREADEGAAAHLFQLLMAAQLPLVALFLVRWLPRAPRQALAVLALQLGSALPPLALVARLHL